jgi:hypothetical protein
MQHQNSEPFSQFGDLIDQLPTDKTVSSHNEILIVDKLFQKNKTMIEVILCNSKDLLLIAGLFMLFSITKLDDFIAKIFPISNNSVFFLTAIKSLLFVLTYFIVKNIHFAKKK